MIPGLALALALLSTITETAPLVPVAQTVTITDVAPAPLPPGIGSYFFAIQRTPMVWIGPTYASAPPEVLAPELAHELVHAADYGAGRLELGRGEGCYDNERRALRIQAVVWRAVAPTGPPSDGSWGPGATVNEAYAQVVGSAYFEQWLHLTYDAYCAVAEPGRAAI